VEAQEGLPKHLLFSQSPRGAVKSQVSAAIAARLSMTTGRIIPEVRSLPGKWICRTEPIKPVPAIFQTMNIWTETSWFALQSRPHHEDLAAGSVANLALETFLPRIRQETLVCGFERMVPLFPGYFFARFTPTLSLERVRYARGVLRVAGSTGYPIPVEENIIAAILPASNPTVSSNWKNRSSTPATRSSSSKAPSLAGSAKSNANGTTANASPFCWRPWNRGLGVKGR
jgi:hypothetical protein